jgi:hypothetical protein
MRHGCLSGLGVILLGSLACPPRAALSLCARDGQGRATITCPRKLSSTQYRGVVPRPATTRLATACSCSVGIPGMAHLCSTISGLTRIRTPQCRVERGRGSCKTAAIPAPPLAVRMLA